MDRKVVKVTIDGAESELTRRLHGDQFEVAGGFGDSTPKCFEGAVGSRRMHRADFVKRRERIECQVEALPLTSLDTLQQWMLAPAESEHLEFKEAKHQFDTVKLLRYCAALANEKGGA